MRNYDLSIKSDLISISETYLSFEDKLLMARKRELRQLTANQQNPSGVSIT